MKHCPIVVAALLMLSWASSAGAHDRDPTAAEAQIADAFDRAVRKDASLDALAGLPWAPGAQITRPELLGHLKDCGSVRVAMVGRMLLISWEGTVDASRPCGEFGYYAQLTLKGGRIKSAVMGESLIIVTARGTPSGPVRYSLASPSCLHMPGTPPCYPCREDIGG